MPPFEDQDMYPEHKKLRELLDRVGCQGDRDRLAVVRWVSNDTIKSENAAAADVDTFEKAMNAKAGECRRDLGGIVDILDPEEQKRRVRVEMLSKAKSFVYEQEK